MKRLLQILSVLVAAGFLILMAYPAARMARGLWMLREPRPVAEFRLAQVNGRVVGPRTCEAGMSGGRLVLGTGGRWQLREELCPPGSYAVWVGTYRWSGDTLTLRRIGARPGERPMARAVLRGDTLDLANTTMGMHDYRYLRIRGTPR